MKRKFLCMVIVVCLAALVLPALAEDILTYPLNVSVNVGKSVTLDITTNAVELEIISPDTSVVTVSGRTVTGVKPGTVTLTLRAMFAGGTRPEVRDIVVKVTDAKSAPAPTKEFALPANLREDVEDVSGSTGFATTTLVIRDTDGEQVGFLEERSFAVYSGDTDDGRAYITTSEGVSGTVSRVGFGP